MNLSITPNSHKALLTASLIAYTTVCNATYFPDKLDHSTIDNYVAKIENKYKNPNINIGIVRNGSLVFHQTYGVMDMSTKEPTRPDAVYQIASVTKAFVGTLAAQLEHEGKVDLDVPIQTYDDLLKFPAEFTDTPITLRHLLTHTAGLMGNPSNRKNITPPANMPDGYDPSIGEPYNVDDLYKAVEVATLKFKPGTARAYSNFGFHLAGHILALASGHKDLESAFKAKIFTPFGMEDSSVKLTDAQLEKLATPYVYIDKPTTYGEEFRDKHYFKAPYWRFGSATGGLGIASTVPDLAKAVGYLSSANNNTDGPIGVDAINKMLTPDHEYLLASKAPLEQGLGWRMNIFGKYGYVYRHTGHNDGHHAFVAFSREHKLGVIILTNGSFKGMERLGNRVLQYALSKVSGNGGAILASK